MNINEWSSTPIPDEIIDQATQWLVALDATEGRTAADGTPQFIAENEFYAWLNQDPLHQAAFSQLSEMWARSAVLEHFDDMLEKSEVLKFPTQLDGHFTSGSIPLRNEAPLFSSEGHTHAAPAWIYGVVLVLISLGLVLSTPFI